MPTVTSGLMTFEEFAALPERPGKQELLQGELIELPPAKKRHNVTSERIYLAMINAAERTRKDNPDPPIGQVHHEMSYRVVRNPDSWLIPDVSLTTPNQPGDDYYEGAPLLAVEVVSPSNSAEQIEAKRQVYLSNGAEEVWIIYPKTRSVLVCRKSGLALIERTLKTELLPGLSIDLEALFAE